MCYFDQLRSHPKADINYRASKSPLLAMCGRLPFGKDYFDVNAGLVGAAMCSACLCGAVTCPLAMMLSADQVPVKSTQSKAALAKMECPDLRVNRLGALVVCLPFQPQLRERCPRVFQTSFTAGSS